ncbi:DUF4118 domain-containing protein [Corynebacterium uropygiale]|uniref:histidine kinase n=1 Tax=Corynebacterium uropygiale TaxID=1775911 RepID=A0A9X1QS28_9CORY|nr:DUF4118 domain-containing protein [Corynebacterium uropygiale]MCF4007726.1 DUF4118 domain-containing protein [Corynebacterium uropygiale]
MEGQAEGTFKVYLGAAPGVGKTCAMLAEARRLQAAGKDVVVGIVEDHGRAYTRDLASSLETIPRDAAGELDVEAVLARHPQIVLVDELAHSAGSKKRWVDIHTLLAAGINVISTVNIQHLESLGDVITHITGTVQRETVPDRVVRDADTVELVDLSPEFLRSRIADGLVYSEQRIGTALNNYFRTGNLIALRELALLWLADQVDDALATYREEQSITDTWETRERVVVAIAEESDAAPLIRRGRRIAQKSSAELLVVHVIGGDAFTSGTLDTMPRIRELAADVDASVHQVTGDSVPEALLHFARAVNATQLVLGTKRHPRWRHFFREDTAHAVARGSGRVDVHLVTLDTEPRSSDGGVEPPHRLRGMLLRWSLAILAPFLTTAVCIALDLSPDIALTSAIFFAMILAVSLVSGIVPALLSAFLAGLLLNWFFTVPTHTFTIAHPSHGFTLVVMLAMALAVALLVDRARQSRREARSASQEADLLATFARTVLRGAQVETVLDKIAKVFGCSSVSAFDESGQLIAIQGEPAKDSVDTPITSHDGTVTLRLWAPHNIQADHRGVLAVVADQVAALRRQEALAAEAAEARALASADKLRRALLSAVSHDLRSPLAAAKVAVSSLRAPDVELSEEDQADLLETVEDSVDELTTLVTNLLDSSRLAADAVSPHLGPVPLEEVVFRAMGRRGYASGLVRVEPSCSGAVVRADRVLLERVLANLIDNALTHAPGTPITVSAAQPDAGHVTISITDEGPGLPAGQEESMWQPFQRHGDRHRDTGVGLGLDVARGFTLAMDGSIELVNREDAPGACARVTLPVGS